MSNQPQVKPDHMLRRMVLSFVIVACSLQAGCAARQLMPTPNLYVNAPVDPFAKVVPAYQTNEVNVLYATDRLPVQTDEGNLEYGYGRSASLAFGSCVVEIGQGVTWEELVQSSRVRNRTIALPLKMVSITEQARFPDTPIPRVMVGDLIEQDPVIKSRQDDVAELLRSEVSTRLAKTSTKEAFIFVHGYNNSFADAAFVIAELWHFLGREGVPIIYTWPAGHGGLLRGYFYDRESGEFTIFHFKQFLRTLASCNELEKIHVIAHSRGTDVASSAIRELVIEARAAGLDPRRKLKIGNFVLAAPDLDGEVVTQRLTAERIGDGAERLTVYVSQTDKAIGLANWLFSSIRRLGQVRLEDLSERQRKGLKTQSKAHFVSANVKSDGSGHGYFHTNSAASSDLILLLRDNLDPGAANGRPLIKLQHGFWELTDDYPNSASHEYNHNSDTKP